MEPAHRVPRGDRPPLIGIELLHEDDDLRISRSGDPAAPNAILCFTGAKHRMGALAPEEFVGTAALPGFSALFVTDKRISWWNAVPAERLTALLGPAIAGKTLHSLGNSMGAFGAIWITRHLPIRVAVAFAPQFSMHPDVVPEEERWTVHRDAIPDWRVRSLQHSFVPGTTYYTFNSPTERAHWSRFPHLPNTRHFMVNGAKHNVGLVFKQQGRLQEVVVACLSGRDDVAAVAGPACVPLPIGEGMPA